MDAASVALTTSATVPKQTSSGGVGPIDPKRLAEDQRADKDKVQSEERVRDAAVKSDAGPGVGIKIDIAA